MTEALTTKTCVHYPQALTTKTCVHYPLDILSLAIWIGGPRCHELERGRHCATGLHLHGNVGKQRSMARGEAADSYIFELLEWLVCDGASHQLLLHQKHLGNQHGVARGEGADSSLSLHLCATQQRLLRLKARGPRAQ